MIGIDLLGNPYIPFAIHAHIVQIAVSLGSFRNLRQRKILQYLEICSINVHAADHRLCLVILACLRIFTVCNFFFIRNQVPILIIVVNLRSRDHPGNHVKLTVCIGHAIDTTEFFVRCKRLIRRSIDKVQISIIAG